MERPGTTASGRRQAAYFPVVRGVAHPHLKMVGLQDALAATGAHLQQCRELDMRYLIVVKPGSHAHLFDWDRCGKRERVVRGR